MECTFKPRPCETRVLAGGIDRSYRWVWEGEVRVTVIGHLYSAVLRNEPIAEALRYDSVIIQCRWLCGEDMYLLTWINSPVIITQQPQKLEIPWWILRADRMTALAAAQNWNVAIWANNLRRTTVAMRAWLPPLPSSMFYYIPSSTMRCTKCIGGSACETTGALIEVLISRHHCNAIR